jgi:arginase
MRKCLASFFVGRFEAGLERHIDAFDIALPASLTADASTFLDPIVRVNVGIRDFVADTISRGETPLVVCGDCLSAIGCLAGLETSNVKPQYLLWFDAHGDFHTSETTISGHLGGMPLAMITGRGTQQILSSVGLTPFHDERVCHIGARDLEPSEAELFRESRIIKANCLSEVEIPPGSSVWIHFDTDYINPLDAPAMRYPAAGGPRADKVCREFDTLAHEFRIVGLSISAWAPHLDTATKTGSTAQVCWQVVSSIASL